MTTKEAVIVSAVRTPVGKAKRGGLQPFVPMRWVRR
jgi:acetyl-CoA acetyltransferase